MLKNPVYQEISEAAREGFETAFSASIGLIPWAIATGVAMVSVGFTTLQAIGMSAIVYAGVAQLGTLPLIVSGAPLWLIAVTALVLNLRFVIFSAAISNGFKGVSTWVRWISSYLLIDGVFACCLDKMLDEEKSRRWKLAYYLAPSLWGWLLWQSFSLIGALAATSIPKNLSLEFLATIALMTVLIQVAKSRPMIIAGATAGIFALLLHSVPLRLGLILATIAGIAAGVGTEYMQKKDKT